MTIRQTWTSRVTARLYGSLPCNSNSREPIPARVKIGEAWIRGRSPNMIDIIKHAADEQHSDDEAKSWTLFERYACHNAARLASGFRFFEPKSAIHRLTSRPSVMATAQMATNTPAKTSIT